jgi:medium-chain acyl-[acyl-carrier-protein] hydrolase
LNGAVCSEHELYCEIAPPAQGFEPFALEACVQAALCAQPRWFEQPVAQPLRCTSVERLSLRAADLRAATCCRVRRSPHGSGHVCVSVLDAAGRVLVEAARVAVSAYSAEERSQLEEARPVFWPEELPGRPLLQAAELAADEGAAASWVIRPVRRTGQPLRLLVFPFSGGSAASCLFWARRLPDQVELCAVELPGHGFRVREPAIEHFGQLLDALDRHLRSEREQPYALFGHSMGALLSFELARRWSADGGRPPAHLFASGLPAPQWFGTESLRLALAEDRLMQHLLSWALVAPSAAGDEHLAGMPQLRADLLALASWRYREGPRLGCSITALCGEDDILTPLARTQAWQEQTAAGFRLVRFPGGHFYFERERAPLFRVIADALVELPSHHLQSHS